MESELSNRLRNALLNANLTLEQARGMSDAQLLRIPMLGRKCVRELRGGVRADEGSRRAMRVAQGRAEERAAIVKWLREGIHGCDEPHELAERIERGEHDQG